MLKETVKHSKSETKETLSQLVFTIEQTKLIREIQRRIQEGRERENWRKEFLTLVEEFEKEAEQNKKKKNAWAIKEWKQARLYRMIWEDDATAQSYTAAKDIAEKEELDELFRTIEKEMQTYGYQDTRDYEL